LAYGRRRADELGIRNIEFAQADILQLPSTGRSFEFVETTGVLHHMADPFGAWLSLSRMVKPGGLMGIGLYSEIARRGIQRCRDLVADWEYPSGLDGLRQVRRRLSGLAEASAVVRLNDFYATSEFRDLVLHVQEQQMSLPQIAEFLRSTDLRFLGFLIDRSTLARYCARFPEDRTASDLASWHRFEQDNPETFLGMYNFLVQRAG
jgi:ubiquinone/menaquinone biosynthesis C-methylase UbiE